MKPDQFILDGYVFGSPLDSVSVMEIDKGAALDYRDQDAEDPFGDSVNMGRDFATPPKWTFTMLAHDDRGNSVQPILNEVAAVWRNDARRKTPGVLSTLRWFDGVSERLAYGRPRNFATDGAEDDIRVITAGFQFAETVSYGPAESLDLSLVGTVEKGITLPQALPWFLDPPSERAGVLSVAGTVATPFRLTIYGPVDGVANNVTVMGDGWTITLAKPLLPGAVVTVDTRRRTALTQTGANVPVTIKSNLAARLKPGTQVATLLAADNSRTTRAELSWRPADTLT